MRTIVAYTNIYTKQENNNPKNTFWRQQKITKNNIAFGSSLDDKLANLEEELSKTKQRIRTNTVYYGIKKKQNNNKILELDRDIQQEKNNNEVLSEKIEELSLQSAEKDIELAELGEKHQVLDKELDKTKKKSGELKNEKMSLLAKIEQDSKSAEIRRQEEIKKATIRINEEFHSEIQTILANAKTALTERVITPTRLENQNSNVDVPGGILIESKSREYSKKLFEWLVKKTNSNYSIIDASLSSNKDLFKIIMNAAQKAQKEFEINRTRTFTFIDNFINCATPKEENYSIIGALKNFLDTCSVEFHNTLVVSTDNPSKLDPIISADHRFQVKVKIDDAFLKHDQFGYNSILKELANAKYTGKEIKPSLFRAIHNGFIKIIKKGI